MEVEDIFSTIEEISKSFDKNLEICFDYENSLSEAKQSYITTIEIFKKIEKSIIMHGLFSPNEEISDLLPETLKYLLLPFYVGDVFGKLHDNRKDSITMSNKYLNEYVKLIIHYELVPKDILSQWKTMQENPKYEPTRDKKIKSFKERKELENKIKLIEKQDDDKSKKELYLTLIQINLHKAISQLKLIIQETEVLQFKEQMEKDKQIKEEYEKPQSKIPLKIFHVPKAEQQNQPYLVNNMKPMCHNCDSFEIANYRKKLESTVWQPGFAQPIMTMDEWADGEFKMFQEMEEKNKKANAQQEKEAEEDSDRDEVGDKKVKKARDWDDWKDDHEKGAGNRKGR